ncbi:hypothetical protein FRC11_012898 [Ceratobasidium sp. 423]|nr:hypothetical protein FRC11_012898 [Ceratobasidium sp. 423]
MDELEACSHCGVMLGACQIRQHLAAYTVDSDSYSDSLPALEDVYQLMLPSPPNPPHQLAGAVGIPANEEMGAGGDNTVKSTSPNIICQELTTQLLNPHVTIKEWPNPDDNFAHSEASKDNLLPKPEFFECRDMPLGYYPKDEVVLDDEELQRLLQAELGDLADEEWMERMYNRKLSDKEYNML